MQVFELGPVQNEVSRALGGFVLNTKIHPTLLLESLSGSMPDRSFILTPHPFALLFLWATDTTIATEEGGGLTCISLCAESCRNMEGCVFALEAAAVY